MTEPSNCHTEIVRIFPEQKEIEINAKEVYLILPKFDSIIQYFEIILGI